MVDTETARTIVGIIGNIISFGLFCAPIPTFMKIFKMKSVEEFKSDPYVATVLNCMMWSFYGMPFVNPDNVLVLTINSIGLVMELVYVTIYFLYAPWPKRRRIILALLVEVIFMAVVILCTMVFLHTTTKRAMLIGILCVVFNIIMYASPLTIMKKVIRSKSVKYMPFFLSLANFLNGTVWSLYALLRFDPYILIPNSLGALSGLVQLILYGVFYRTTNWDERSDLELANHA